MGVYASQKKELLPVNKKDLFIAGLFLYLGEGSKTREAELALSNTNPTIIKFFIYFLTKICGVPTKKLRVNLHLYKDMNVNKERIYWANTLKLKADQFRKPYIKYSTKKNINHKGGFGHGTCNIIVGDVHLFEKIMMSIKVITDNVTGQ